MSEQNVAIVRQLYAAFDQRGIAAISAVRHLLDPEVEAQSPSDVPEPGRFTGIEALEARMRTLLEPFEEVHIEPVRFIDRDPHVIVIVRILGRGRGSGVEVSTEFVHVWTLREGRVIRHAAYSDEAEALEAVGRR